MKATRAADAARKLANIARGRNNKAKGKKAEQKVARILRETMPEIASAIRRGWQSRVGCDDPDVCGLPGMWIESKCGHQPNMRAAYKQAVADSGGRAIPLAVIQDNHARDRLVVLSFRDFLRILRSAYGYCPPLKYGIQGELFPDTEDAEEQREKSA